MISSSPVNDRGSGGTTIDELMQRRLDLKTDMRVLFGEGALGQIGALAKELGFSRTLLVADRGLARAGHLGHAHLVLNDARIEALEFSDFGPNPDGAMLEAGRAFATGKHIDSIIGLGGGSSLDCAKGINFLLTQGGTIVDFHGYGKATKPMLPMIGVPTTAGTGSEAQSYAIISDTRTHRKLACGDPKAAFRAVILDPLLTLTQPPAVTAAAGYDAIAHAVESFVCTKRNPRSQELSREAWRLLEANFERVLTAPNDLDARASMQLGAFYAGTAIEQSMLGATHACANPLTARYGTTHGDAIAILLPHVVRWNANAANAMYSELLHLSGSRRNGAGDTQAADALATRLDQLASVGGLPRTLKDIGASRDDLSELARDAAGQWTGQFNPRPFDAMGAREVYTCAF
jgi:alcohol dehydrogenase